MENEKLFLNPRLTLQLLAKELNIPYPVISRTINQGMKTNFNELVNTYRVKEAIRLLQSPQINHLTIEAIAEMAGFNSSSSFNYNFKKITGRPPKYYKARLETGKSLA
jgi:AraC-like DNA-binding protein